MASVTESPSSSTIPAMPRAEERLVDEQIRRTRRSLKLVDFASGMITLVIGVLIFLLCTSALEHWVIPGGWNGPTRLALFVGMLLGIAWFSWQTFWPLISRPINPAYAAQLIERSSPSLKNSLLNFLLLRTRRQQIAQKVYEAIEQQAAQRLSEVSIDSVVDRSALLRLGYVLMSVVVVCALYRVLSPKNLTSSMERVLMPWSDIVAPSRVEILKVAPGNTQIARGEQLEVSAEVIGARDDDQVRVRYSTLDGQSVDREVMLSAAAGGMRYSGRLPDRFAGTAQRTTGGVQQDLEYWIEAGDAKSPKYKVTVFARPTLVVEKIRYQFPTYTGLPPREVEGTGDIHGLEGTKVTLYALANHDIATAEIDFNADGRHDLKMNAVKDKADAQFELRLQEDRRTPEFDSYVLQYKTTNGRSSSLPPKYNIDVTPDYAPEIRLIGPADEDGTLIEQLDVPIDGQFTVEVEARDLDFALANVVVLGEKAGEQVLRHDLLAQAQSGKFTGKMTASPAELGLKVGDELEYWGAAVDNRQPEPNTAQTERLRIRVVGPPQPGNQQGQGDQPQGGDGGQGGDQGQGESGDSGDGLAGGGKGEQGEQGEGQSGTGGESGQGDSKNEQQGEQGQGGGAGGEKSDSQNSQGAGGDSKGEGGGQQGEQQSGEQSDPNGGGGENPSTGQPGGEGKVSPEGDDDATAFEKMSEHFAEKDSDSKSGQGQASQGESETEQSESEQGETESGQGDGKGSPEDQQAGNTEDGKNQDQGIGGTEEGEQSEGSGAEGQPNEQREQQKADPEQKDNGEQDAPGGKMSTEQGEQGAGNNPGENEGSADTDGGRKSRDKSDKSPESELNDKEPPGQSNSQQENDSKGANGGDNAGGGQEGAGQQADSEGTGTAGENTSADDGAGQSKESGAGENSSKAGQQGESDKPTGESSENKPGEGTKESDQAGGEQPGGEQNQAEHGGEPEQKPGEAQTSEGGEEGASKGQQPGDQSQPPAGDQQGDKPTEDSPPNGPPGEQTPNGAGTGSNNAAGSPAGEVEPGDEANLDYAKKQTDLVLDRLDDQLNKNEVDKDLLEKLGWSKEELRQFVNRWKKLKAEAAQAPADHEQDLNDALRSLGIDLKHRTGYQSTAVKEKIRDLKDSYRGQTPIEYADQVRAYIKGTATVPDEKKN